MFHDVESSPKNDRLQLELSIRKLNSSRLTVESQLTKLQDKVATLESENEKLIAENVSLRE
jgi:hypothetical protein